MLIIIDVLLNLYRRTSDIGWDSVFQDFCESHIKLNVVCVVLGLVQALRERVY